MSMHFGVHLHTCIHRYPICIRHIIVGGHVYRCTYTYVCTTLFKTDVWLQMMAFTTRYLGEHLCCRQSKSLKIRNGSATPNAWGQADMIRHNQRRNGTTRKQSEGHWTSAKQGTLSLCNRSRHISERIKMLVSFVLWSLLRNRRIHITTHIKCWCWLCCDLIITKAA